MSSIPEITKECRAAMDKAVENSKREFGSIRSGKASPTLLDTVRVEAYGQTMPLSQVASVSAPEPRLLTVTPSQAELWEGPNKLVAAAIMLTAAVTGAKPAVGDHGKVRLDKWLWAARFYKTRSEATEAVAGGKVEVNGDPAKPAKAVQVGDTVRVRKAPHEYHLTVTGLGERRGSAEAAAGLYQESEASRIQRERLAEQHRMAPHFNASGTRPSKQDRRAWDRLRGRD